MTGTDVAALDNLRVIVVEDEPLIAMFVADTIEERGGVVVGTAGKVDAALILAQTAGFDVAVLDLHLEGLSVVPVAIEVMRRGQGIVFASGSGGASLPEEFRKWPMVIKPYADDALVAAVASANETRARL